MIFTCIYPLLNFSLLLAQNQSQNLKRFEKGAISSVLCFFSAVSAHRACSFGPILSQFNVFCPLYLAQAPAARFLITIERWIHIIHEVRALCFNPIYPEGEGQCGPSHEKLRLANRPIVPLVWNVVSFYI